MVWLAEPRALVPGDRLLGADGGGLRLSPDSWLRYLPSGMRARQLREALRPLLDLPVERVLVSHGEPVLRGGREAIARALEP
jgi:glyoxylase-like metal-dependent hydrolase (beta-lactamase superfamily II)